MKLRKVKQLSHSCSVKKRQSRNLIKFLTSDLAKTQIGAQT